MKKLLHVLSIATVLLYADVAQAQYLAINGQLAHTGGAPIPVLISHDGNMTGNTVYTDPNGFFTDTIFPNTSGVVYMSFTDCDTIYHLDSTQYFLNGAPVVFYNDYCPGSPTVDSIYISGNISGSGGVLVPVYVQAPGVNTTFTTDGNGNYSGGFSVSSLPAYVYVFFYNAIGFAVDTQFMITTGNSQLIFNGIYSNNPCPNPPVLTSTVTNATCAGSDGAIIVAVTGVNQPFNYQWSNGAFFPNNTNLAPGIYCLTVTDAAGCTASGCYTVGQSNTMQVALSSIDDSTGTWTIASTVSGGSAPYIWTWNNGSIASTLTTVDSGTYCVTVTDASGCTASNCVTVGNATTAYVLYGVLVNTNQDSVPVTIIADGVTTAITTLPNGSFTATVLLSDISNPVFISFTDCNGIFVNEVAFVSPGTTGIYYTAYYCPVATPIVINGQLDNTNGAAVTLLITTDANPLGQDATTDSNGDFVFTTTVNNIANPIGIEFTDCNGLLQFDQVFVDSITNTASFTADYCQTLPPPCDTLFTVTYCTCDTAFTLEMDSATQASGVPYMWDFGDGTIDSTNLFPVHTYAVSGIYNVCLYTMTPGNFCSYCHEIGFDSLGNVVTRMDLAGFIIKIVPFGTTGVDEVTPNQSFDIYPNPLDENGTVSLYSDKATTYTINIFNPLGQRIRTFSVNVNAGRNEFHLPVQDLAKGFYMMTIDFESKQISRSFVK